MKPVSLLIGLLLTLGSAVADDKSVKTYGDNKVYFSAFNSSFVTPEVASVYNISRGADKGLVNIAVVPAGAESGKTALVGGTVNDLLARQQVLNFIEIREGDAVYYLAPFDFDNEDPLTFTVNVRPGGSTVTHSFSFQRTFYKD
jgi:hypothetical protein